LLDDLNCVMFSTVGRHRAVGNDLTVRPVGARAPNGAMLGAWMCLTSSHSRAVWTE
jgi:hypothetical protein